MEFEQQQGISSSTEICTSLVGVVWGSNEVRMVQLDGLGLDTDCMGFEGSIRVCMDLVVIE